MVCCSESRPQKAASAWRNSVSPSRKQPRLRMSLSCKRDEAARSGWCTWSEPQRLRPCRLDLRICHRPDDADVRARGLPGRSTACSWPAPAPAPSHATCAPAGCPAPCARRRRRARSRRAHLREPRSPRLCTARMLFVTVVVALSASPAVVGIRGGALRNRPRSLPPSASQYGDDALLPLTRSGARRGRSGPAEGAGPAQPCVRTFRDGGLAGAPGLSRPPVPASPNAA